MKWPYPGWLMVIWIFGLSYMASMAGQITIPLESPRDTVIEATIETGMPEGAEFHGGWDTPGVSSIPVSENKIHIAGKPGGYIVMNRGYWLHLGEEITVKDINGKEHTFRPLYDHGRVDAKEPYKITGTPDPEPDPDPDPTPDPGPEPGPKQIVFFVVSDDLDKPSVIRPAQRELVTSLQVRQDLLDRGHELIQIIDNGQIKEGVPSRWTSWVKAAMNKPLPLMAYADKGGGPITTVPLPRGFDELLNELEGGK